MSFEIYLSAPHMSGLERKYLEDALDSNWIAPLGPHVTAFESEIANYVGKTCAAALSSGTAAIHLALKVLGVEVGDEVFCSTLTFIGSANPILYLNAKPVFIDAEPDSWNMSAAALERALFDRKKTGRLPKALIVVNLYGQSANYDNILPLAESYNIPVIEDAAESLGAEYKGRKSGSFGDLSILSFNGNKIITTSGGGMLLSDDDNRIKRARFLSTQSREPAPHYEHHQMGFNYRMSNLLAAVGRGQLRVLDSRVQRRREIFDHYRSRLGGRVHFMPEIEHSKSNRWLSVCRLPPQTKKSPSDFVRLYAEEKIEVRPVWKPMHRQRVFDGCVYFSHDQGRSFSDEVFADGLCLPSGSGLQDAQVERVIQLLEKWV